MLRNRSYQCWQEREEHYRSLRDRSLDNPSKTSPDRQPVAEKFVIEGTRRYSSDTPGPYTHWVIRPERNWAFGRLPSGAWIGYNKDRNSAYAPSGPFRTAHIYPAEFPDAVVLYVDRQDVGALGEPDNTTRPHAVAFLGDAYPPDNPTSKSLENHLRAGMAAADGFFVVDVRPKPTKAPEKAPERKETAMTTATPPQTPNYQPLVDPVNLLLDGLTRGGADFLTKQISVRAAEYLAYTGRLEIAETLLTPEGQRMAALLGPALLLGLAVVAAKSESGTVSTTAATLIPTLEAATAAGIGGLTTPMLENFFGNTANKAQQTKIYIEEQRQLRLAANAVKEKTM